MDEQSWLAIAFQIPLLATAGVLITRGTFITGREANARVEAIQKILDRREEEHAAELKRRNDTLMTQIEYREKLRAEEREGRVKAEERLATMAKSMDQVTDFLSSIEKEVIRGRPRS
jgi:hypothetical protein